MAWYDGFAAVDRALGGRPVTGGFKPYKPPVRGFGAVRPQGSGINWSDLASGRMATSRPSVAQTPAVSSPDRINIAYPYSSTGARSPYAPPPVSAPISTEGDLLGSFGASAGQAISNLNLANVVPYFMERMNVAAHDLAASDVPVAKQAAGIIAPATQMFIDAVETASQPLGQVLDAFPSWVRDSQLKDRAKLYRAIANGEMPEFNNWLKPETWTVSNPISTLGQIGSLFTPGLGLARSQGVLGQTVSEQASQAAHWQKVLRDSVDPQRRLEADQMMAILRESIELPESVKLQLERNPRASDDEVAKWLDDAPEGKAWSYDPGPAGMVQNFGNPLLFYLAEAKAGFGAFGAARASTIPGVARTAGLVGKGVSVTAKLQTAAVASGVAITAVNTTMGAIARYAGEDAAIEWFDNANRTTDFSDDPMVQLVTGFSVNPIAAVKMLKRGVVATKHGIEMPIDKATGGKLLNHYTDVDQLHERVAKMYKLGSREEAARFLDEQGLREDAYDHVMAPALDLVLDRLPKNQRVAWNLMHADPDERSIATLARFGEDAADLWKSDPDLVAARFHDHDWNYRMMPGPFNAEVAAKIANDYRRAMNRTHDLRAQQRAVVGYREYLPPQGQALARQALEAADIDGMVPLRALQDLVADFPALRKHWGGVAMTEQLPKATVERIIENASAEWALAAKVNPVKVRTGVDPVLRPGSPTLQRDYAEALGTNIDTVRAISDTTPNKLTNTQLDLLRRFIVDKAVVPDEAAAAALSPEDLWSKAADYIDETTTPWLAMGERLAAAETQTARLRGELARVTREKGATQHDRTVRIQREINELADLMRLAGDPIRTAASRLSAALRPRGLGDSHLADLAARKVDALERLRVLQSVSDDLDAAGLTEADLVRVVRGVDGELTDIFDVLDAPPTPVLDTFLAFRTANMRTWVNKPGEFSSRRQNVFELSQRGQAFVRDTEAAPGSYQWAEIAKSPGFVRRMREIGDDVVGDTDGMTGNQVADIVEAAGLAKGMSGASIDDVAAALDTDRAGALERLAGLRKARETALDGKGVAAVKRTAGIKVSDDYVAQAEADRAARSLVYDAEYDAFWHPRNVAKVLGITGQPDELYAGLRAVAEGDAEVMEGIARVAARTGRSVDEVLSDPAHAAAVKAEIVPADFEAPVEGLIREWTDLDNLITSGDGDAIAALAEQLAEQRAQPRPPVRVSKRVAEQLARMPTKRRSYQYRREVSDAGGDFKAAPAERILADPANRIGVETLSVLNHGIPGTKPATVDGVIALLRDIEDGAATRMGVGPELQAEAQRVARALLDDAVTAAKRDPNVAGTFGGGVIRVEDEVALARTVDDLISFDQADPLGTLQYGMKKAPTDAVVIEWSKIPGLAEEMLSRRFQPYAERVGTTQVRQAYNWIFGGRSNAVIRAEAQNRFTERVGRQGVTPETARSIWDAWGDMSRASRMPSLRKGPTGARRYIGGDRPLYADVWNIPDRRLDALVHGSRDLKIAGVLDDLSRAGKISSDEFAAASQVDYAQAFRESSSFIRRTMADSKVPLGQAIADAYGLAAHNEITTTLYYWFRFGLDIRYHAMNFFERHILAAGRAGLRRGEIDEGLLGQSEQFLRNRDIDPVNNTGYPFSRDRHESAYKVFLKEQPDALRDTLRGVASEDPTLIRKALEEMAQSDTQLADMIREMDGFAPGQKIDPTKYLKELDGWHRKMLANVDEADDALVIDEALAKEMADTPHLNELYGRLGQANKDLWADIRQTFYGNPNRSRAERFLNSYLMFWPLSYQVKSTKWFAKVLFDRAGGLPTNALGAVTLDRMADTHNRLLATDPEYRDWFEKHETLVFVAQMFFPVSFESVGVSLNPALRGIFFERDPLNALNIGPIYTYNRVIRPVAEEIEVDLYPTIGDYQAAQPGR